MSQQNPAYRNIAFLWLARFGAQDSQFALGKFDCSFLGSIESEIYPICSATNYFFPYSGPPELSKKQL